MELDDLTVTRLFDVMTIPISGGTRKQIKNRYGYGLTFCRTVNGKIVYEFRGREFVSDYEHAVLLPMGQTYMLHGVSTGEFPLLNFYSLSPLNGDDFAVFELGSPNYYLQTYEQIRQLCRSSQPYCRAKALSLFYELLSHLMTTPSDESGILSAALAYMDRNFDDPELRLEQVAEEARVSVGYLRKLFKERYSIPPKQYIINARMVKAKELLVSGSCDTVLSVALQCGFTNIYHFDRAFKAYTGCSPNEFIREFAQRL